MGRLIDADLLSKKINHIGYVPVCVDCMTKHNILEIIDAQPTAYDVDKTANSITDLCGKAQTKGEYKAYWKAAGIVKGAVKDE
jgi:hypothetical protein